MFLKHQRVTRQLVTKSLAQCIEYFELTDHMLDTDAHGGMQAIVHFFLFR